MSGAHHDIALADRQARATAIDPTRSFIVQAPAGSGKTELLIQRMLSLLSRATHPSEVLAITFTKKAAGEMRSRLVEALRAAASNVQPEDSPERERWQLARSVAARDAEMGWQLLARPTLLAIDTFDAFSLRLTKLAPLESGGLNVGLHALQENAAPLHREAARRAVLQVEDAQSRRAVSSLLIALDNRVDDIIALIAALLGKRAQWMNELIDDSDEAIAAMRDVLERSVAARVAKAHRFWPASKTSQITALAAYAADNLDDETQQAQRILIASSGFDEIGVESIEAWQALSEFLLTQTKTWRKQFDKGDGFPAPSEKGISRQDKEGRAQAKAQMVNLLTELSESEHGELLRSALAKVHAVPTAAAIAAHEPILRAALRVLKLAAAELMVLEHARAQTDFSGVSLAAKTALLEHRDDVFARLDAKIQHVLVDEFQDTNPAQASLIETLVEDWLPGDRRTLFLVGDPMQSVYAFRDADVGIFMDAWSRGVGHVELVPLTLLANYRSRPQLVDWVNRSLAPVFSSTHNDDELASVAFVRAFAARASGSTSEREPRLLALDNPDEEARHVVDRIVEIQGNNSTARIAILVRVKKHASAILRELQHRGVAFAARDLATWGDRPLIRDLLSLTYVVAQPADRLAWYSWLRSPMVGLSLDALSKFGQAQLTDRIELPALLYRAPFLDSLDTEDRVRLERARVALEFSSGASDLGTLAERVHAVFVACGGALLAADTTARNEVESFLAFLDDHASDGFLPARSELESLMSAQTQSFANTTHARPVSCQPVEILSIHKSKGLEWDYVFIPQFDRAGAVEKRELVIWDFVRYRQDKTAYMNDRGNESSRAPARLLVAAKETRTRLANSVFQFVQDRKTAAREEELKRLLYVAVTRAREQLVVSGSATAAGKTPSPRSLAALLDWPVREANLAATSLEKPTSARLIMQRSLTRLVSVPEVRLLNLTNTAHSRRPFRDAVSDAEPDADNARERSNEIAVGVVGHQLIEGLARGLRSARAFDPSAAVIAQRLLAQGVATAHAATATAMLLAALDVMRQSTHFAWIQDASHIDSADELALSSTVGEQTTELRVDRTFVTATGVRWIVDYKFAVAPAAIADNQVAIDRWLDVIADRYREQLAAYSKVFSRIEPEREIRTALYLPTVDRFLPVDV